MKEKYLADSVVAFSASGTANFVSGGGHEITVIVLGILSPFLKEFILFGFRKIVNRGVQKKDM